MRREWSGRNPAPPPDATGGTRKDRPGRGGLSYSSPDTASAVPPPPPRPPSTRTAAAGRPPTSRTIRWSTCPWGPGRAAAGPLGVSRAGASGSWAGRRPPTTGRVTADGSSATHALARSVDAPPTLEARPMRPGTSDTPATFATPAPTP